MIKAGVLCGDRWHPAATVMAGLRAAVDGAAESSGNAAADIHEEVGTAREAGLPEVAAEPLEGAAGAGKEEAAAEAVELEALPKGAELTRSWLAGQDVVVLAKLNHRSEEEETPWLTPGIKAALMDYVAAGGGLLVIHAGTAGFKEDAEFHRFVGGVFNYHPKACEVRLSLNAAAAPFPVGEGDIVVHDEHYMMDMADDAQEVFMTSSSEHGVQAAGWVRRHGGGKVCVLTPGHFLKVWQEPGYRALIAQALRWCAGKA